MNLHAGAVAFARGRDCSTSHPIEAGTGVLPDCYTGRCTCDFLESLSCAMPASALETAVYTEGDGLVDWRCYRANRPESDFSVSGARIGLAFDPSVYSIIAARLILANSA